MSYWKHIRIRQMGTLLKLEHADVRRVFWEWEKRISGFSPEETADPLHLKSWSSVFWRLSR